MEDLGVAFSDEDGWVVPYCHVMPVKVVNQTVYLATDLHPNILSTTTIGDDEGAVMYIGPDSLALMDHWQSRQPQVADASIVDFGTGSGIQALTMALVCGGGGDANVTCVDINPRALRLTRLNFGWNGMKEPTLILGDVSESTGRIYNNDANMTLSWRQILGQPTMILANPPFLPVPVQDSVISKRHGLFSSGGASGEIVMQRIVELASESLSSSSGTLAIVSEFMNPNTDFRHRLAEWWGDFDDGRPAKAILFTNEQAMDAEIYAQRRADSEMEVGRWKRHLEDEKITHISPGLLFVRKAGGKGGLEFSQYLVPKMEQGSIWTPTNRYAREYTRDVLDSLHWLSQKQQPKSS
jgi:methylase of polypeptide subunit release factors